ncbi:MAG: phosphomannomutase/phosphoglucomutase [Halobacteria archaeon]|nr:phosphomannomutase/phosphoglucomutase [Halobacteria archaeon]
MTVSFFHAYDLRGRYPDELGEDEALRVGKAFGTLVDADEVLVGRDGRMHGKDVANAFIDGITSTGTDVLYAGMEPTPVIYFGTDYLDVEASAAVTASHNPPEYTGFKFSKQNALAMSREGGMAEMERIYAAEEFDEVGEGEKGEVEDVELEDDYVEFVKERIDLKEEIDVAVNFGNGVTAEIGRRVLEEIGCNVESINDTIDGDFPNHLPAPGEKEAQEQLSEILEGKDLGILFDGDGDRAGFMVDGKYVEGDDMLAIFSEECLKRKTGKVVYGLRSSKVVPETIEENGGEPVESRVGHTFISETIHADTDVVFAGEVSGHFYFPVLDVPWDDGIFAAAFVCQIATERALAEVINALPNYPVSPELRIDCPEHAKAGVVERVKEKYADEEVSTVDGAKVFFDDGWALVRPSNTEEKMSVRCEADTEEALDRILDDVEGAVREAIEELR